MKKTLSPYHARRIKNADQVLGSIELAACVGAGYQGDEPFIFRTQSICAEKSQMDRFLRASCAPLMTGDRARDA